MIIGVDVDGVLLDIHTPWINYYNHLSGDKLTVDDIVTWRMSNHVYPSYKFEINSLRLPSLYNIVKPVSLASFGVTSLQSMGHRLVCVSHDSARYARTKGDAIHRYFPSIRDVVFTSNVKSIVKYDLLIDDAAHNNPHILFSQPWNRYSKGNFVRAYSWLDIVRIIEVSS